MRIDIVLLLVILWTVLGIVFLALFRITLREQRELWGDMQFLNRIKSELARGQTVIVQPKPVHVLETPDERTQLLS